MFVEFMMAVCHDLAFSHLFLCICCSFLHLLIANVLGVGGWAEKASQSTTYKTPCLRWWRWELACSYSPTKDNRFFHHHHRNTDMTNNINTTAINEQL